MRYKNKRMIAVLYRFISFGWLLILPTVTIFSNIQILIIYALVYIVTIILYLLKYFFESGLWWYKKYKHELFNRIDVFGNGWYPDYANQLMAINTLYADEEGAPVSKLIKQGKYDQLLDRYVYLKKEEYTDLSVKDAIIAVIIGAVFPMVMEEYVNADELLLFVICIILIIAIIVFVTIMLFSKGSHKSVLREYELRVLENKIYNYKDIISNAENIDKAIKRHVYLDLLYAEKDRQEGGVLCNKSKIREADELIELIKKEEKIPQKRIFDLLGDKKKKIIEKKLDECGIKQQDESLIDS